MSPLLLPLLLFTFIPLSYSRPYLDSHDHDFNIPLPDTWYQPPDHPVHRLFRRAPPTTDGITYPPVGSQEWRNAYPPGVPDVSQLPQPWVDALNAAISAGSIPNITQSVNPSGTSPQYPGQDPAGPAICAAAAGCHSPADIYNAPKGVIGIGFDDGPFIPSASLYQFLQSQNQKATHFMIGINILAYSSQFTMAVETLQDDIAVHTWTHPYMTTLSNLDVLAQLGWSMQLIHNSTGGRVPKYWRPPYGDLDNRVRAIAKVVFGLDTILWNQDTSDWSLGLPTGTTPEAVAANLQRWITGPKSPGLIILEHELSNGSVQAFINAYPAMKSNNWNLISVSRLGPTGSPWQNANTSGPVTSQGILLAGNNPTTSTSASTSAPATSSASSAGSNSSPSSSSASPHPSNGGMANYARVSSITIGMALFAVVTLVV